MGQNKILISVWESKDRVAIQLNLSLATSLVETLWACAVRLSQLKNWIINKTFSVLISVAECSML